MSDNRCPACGQREPSLFDSFLRFVGSVTLALLLAYAALAAYTMICLKML